MSEKCSPDDPRRCMGVTPHGQCGYLAVEGSKKCSFHANGRNTRDLNTKRLNRYLIDNENLKQAYQRHNDDSGYLDMRDDISLLHAMIERRLSCIKNDSDVMMAIGPFNQLMQRVESMKISLMKLQQQLGMVLGKDELRQVASVFAQILDEELDGLDDKHDRMDRLMKRLGEALEEAGKKGKDE